MAKICAICGKRPQTGHNIRHKAKRGAWARRAPKTTRRWLPNLQRVRVLYQNSPKSVWVCAKCLKQGKVQRVPSA